MNKPLQQQLSELYTSLAGSGKRIPLHSTRSSRDTAYKASAYSVRDDLVGQTGISVGNSASNPSSVLDALPGDVKIAAVAGKAFIMGNGYTVPFWCMEDRVVYFGGSTVTAGDGANNTPKLQGDLAYEAFKAKVCWDLAINAGRSSGEQDAMRNDYNTKIALVYAA